MGCTAIYTRAKSIVLTVREVEIVEQIGKSLGQWLRELREAKQMSIRMVAESLYMCSADKLVRIEAGEAVPSKRLFNNLTKLLDADADEAAEVWYVAKNGAWLRTETIQLAGRSGWLCSDPKRPNLWNWRKNVVVAADRETAIKVLESHALECPDDKYWINRHGISDSGSSRQSMCLPAQMHSDLRL